MTLNHDYKLNPKLLSTIHSCVIPYYSILLYEKYLQSKVIIIFNFQPINLLILKFANVIERPWLLLYLLKVMAFIMNF